jgi:hypothetical protein
MRGFGARWGHALAFALALSGPRVAAAQEGPVRMSDLPMGEAYRVEAFIATWRPRADVTLSSDAEGVPGTRIDLRSELGLVNESFPEVQITVRPGLKHKIRFQYIPIHFDAVAAIPRPIVFNGATYPAGLLVTTSLDWTTYRFGYEYDFALTRRGSAGVVAEVKHTLVRARLLSAMANEASRQAMPVPALGGVARLQVSTRVSVKGELTFFGVPDRPDGHYGGHIADLDLSAAWNLSRYVGAQAGFRNIDINHLGEWNTATVGLKGVYVAALVRY